MTLVARLVSQPLVATPSQSPRPALQRKPHVDEAQVVAAPARAGQALRQAPQLATSVVLLLSQPSAGSPLQSKKPLKHVVAQTPARHAGEPFGPPVHAVPHPPQCVESPCTSKQALLQHVWPAAHIAPPQGVWQKPPVHVWPVPQRMLHPPQLASSVLSSTQVPPQLVCLAPHDRTSQVPVGPGEQQAMPMHSDIEAGHRTSQPPQLLGSFCTARHVPPQHPWLAPQGTAGQLVGAVLQSPSTQVCPAAQRRLQPPQLFGSVCVGMHAVPQHERAMRQPVAAQLSVVQAPPTQLCPAAHRVPQPPQLAGSVVTSRSQPFAGLRSQSPNPRSHAPTPHVDAVQAGVPRATGGHVTPQPPQFVRLDRASMQRSPQQVAPVGQAPPRQGATQAKSTHDDPAAQSVPVRHATHWRVSRRQRGVTPPQSAVD